MDYSLYSDEELITQFRDKDPGVTTYILNKYKNLVRGKSGSMFIYGGDIEDLIQEGMIGLYEAVMDYDIKRKVKFITFAELCVVRQIYSAISSAESLKHSPLNFYTSIYDEDFQKEGGVNPEETFLDNEKVEYIEKRLDEVLSPFEKQVMDLKKIGMSYTQIATSLGKTPKTTDNAITRIKSKLKEILKDAP